MPKDDVTPPNLSKDFAQKRIVHLFKEMVEAAKMAGMGESLSLYVHGADVSKLNASEFKIRKNECRSPDHRVMKYKVASHKKLAIIFFSEWTYDR
jgi:hypothetical protein